jgi:biopolymer transport protein ExbD
MAGGGGEENPVAINVVAMVDVIFCLCLFFMCCLAFPPVDAKLESWLPKDVGPKAGPAADRIDPIRVLLSWDSGRNRLQRIWGLGRPVPAGRDGDALLRDLIAAEHARGRASGRGGAPVIIDAGPLVPWSDVVAVMDVARDAGVPTIELAQGTALTR